MAVTERTREGTAPPPFWTADYLSDGNNSTQAEVNGVATVSQAEVNDDDSEREVYHDWVNLKYSKTQNKRNDSK
jgi:hypothetical protein